MHIPDMFGTIKLSINGTDDISHADVGMTGDRINEPSNLRNSLILIMQEAPCITVNDKNDLSVTVF